MKLKFWEPCGDEYKQVDVIDLRKLPMTIYKIASVSERTYGKIIISFMNGCILFWDQYSVVKSKGVR